MSRIEKSCSFVCLKWLLFGICFVLIYFDLMLILFSDSIADSFYHFDNKEVMNRTLMVESVLSILFSLIGIIGAFKESYCCTVLFSIFMTLSVLTEIYSSIVAPIFWFFTILYIFITMISFSFARQIREHIIEEVLQPQSAFMRDYGRGYGLRFNSFQFYSNRNSNPVIEMQTIEFEGRQLPPYYSHDTQPSSMDVQPLPSYEELPTCPPSYQESLRNSNKTNGNNNNNAFVEHI